MHCPKCGVELVDHAVFCHKCGEHVPREGAGPENAAAAGQPPAERLRAGNAMHSSNLADPGIAGEQDLWEGRYSGKAMLGNWLLLTLISIALLVVFGYWIRESWAWWALAIGLLIAWLWQTSVYLNRRFSRHYRLTTLKFVHTQGLLWRVTDRMDVIDMDDVTYVQGVLDRMLNVGTLQIRSTDVTHPFLVLEGIDNVADVAAQFDNARRHERRRRGMFIENG